MKRTIFPYEFSPYYPIGIQPCPMYVDVANRIYYKIKDMDINLPDTDKLKKEIAINAAIYLRIRCLVLVCGMPLYLST